MKLFDKSVLVTERLTMRPFDWTDAVWFAEAEWAVKTSQGLVNSEAERAALRRVARDRVRERIELWESQLGASFAIEVRAEAGAVVGEVQLIVDWDADELGGEIGFWVVPAYRRRGVASEAVREVVRWALLEVGLERVWGRTQSQNVGARRVMMRAGMTRWNTEKPSADEQKAGSGLVGYEVLPSDIR